MGVIGYDITETLSDTFNLNSHGLEVTPITNKHYEQLKRIAENEDSNITLQQIEYITKAANNPNVVPLIAHDVQGTPLGVLIANSNFSSFRTVYGYKVDFLQLTNDTNIALQAGRALLSQMVFTAIENQRTGHLVTFIDPTSQAQMDLMQHLRAKKLLMSANPDSILNLYAINSPQATADNNSHRKHTL